MTFHSKKKIMIRSAIRRSAIQFIATRPLCPSPSRCHSSTSAMASATPASSRTASSSRASPRALTISGVHPTGLSLLDLVRVQRLAPSPRELSLRRIFGRAGRRPRPISNSYIAMQQLLVATRQLDTTPVIDTRSEDSNEESRLEFELVYKPKRSKTFMKGSSNANGDEKIGSGNGARESDNSITRPSIRNLVGRKSISAKAKAKATDNNDTVVSEIDNEERASATVVPLKNLILAIEYRRLLVEDNGNSSGRLNTLLNVANKAGVVRCLLSGGLKALDSVQLPPSSSEDLKMQIKIHRSLAGSLQRLTREHHYQIVQIHHSLPFGGKANDIMDGVPLNQVQFDKRTVLLLCDHADYLTRDVKENSIHAYIAASENEPSSEETAIAQAIEQYARQQG